MKAFLVLVLLFSPAIVPAVSHAESPYVFDIVRERGSVEGVDLAVEEATQAYIISPGYEKYNILGRRVTIEGRVVNRTALEFGALALVISARDIFGETLDSCELDVRLPPEGKEPFRCVLEVAVASRLMNITYRITDKAPAK